MTAYLQKEQRGGEGWGERGRGDVDDVDEQKEETKQTKEEKEKKGTKKTGDDSGCVSCFYSLFVMRGAAATLPHTKPRLFVGE